MEFAFSIVISKPRNRPTKKYLYILRQHRATIAEIGHELFLHYLVECLLPLMLEPNGEQ